MQFAARSALGVVILLVLTACAPTAPAPTAAPAKPTEAPAPAAPAASPAAVAPGAPAPALAASPAAKPAAFDEKAVADFYTGKTVHLIVGSSPGGGYDTYARLIARHLGKSIPGNPTVVVENMAGAASLVATNHVYNVAPQDGTVILHFLGGVMAQQLLGNKGVQFDATKLQFLGAPAADTAVLHVHKRAGITRLDDIIGPNAKQLIVGGNAPGSMNVDAPTVVREVLNANIKIVQGFPGSSDVRLAMERGEVDGFFNAWESTKITNLEDVKNGTWINIFQLTDKPHRELPEVPTIREVAKSEEQRLLLLYGYAVPGQFARPFVVAPGVPSDRVQAMRSAFVKTLEDKEFLADADKSKITVEPLTGDQLQKLVADYMAIPADLKSKLQKILAAPA